jgi:hypothetical protein
MFKKLCLVVLFIAFTGCAHMVKDYNELLAQVPDAGFKDFSYTRNIMGSSADISAKDAFIKDGVLNIGYLKISEQFPGGGVLIQLTDYHRRLPPGTAIDTVVIKPDPIQVEIVN